MVQPLFLLCFLGLVPKMRKLTLILVAVTSVYFMSGCKSNNKTEENIENLEFCLKNNNLSFVDSLVVTFVQLEESTNALFKSVGQVQQYGNLLLISDDGNFNLYVYGMDGTYIGQIGSRGHGSGEYVMLSSFFVEDDEKEICLWDGESRKLLTYSLSDYNFIGEKHIPEISSKCCVPLDNYLIWYNDAYETGNSDNYFIVTDKMGITQKSFIKKEFKSGYITGSSYPLFTFEGKVMGYTPYKMVLYSMNEEGVTGRLNINIKDFSMPDIAFLNDISDNGQSVSLFKSLSDSKYVSYYDVIETKDLIGLTVIRDNENYFGIADKRSGATYFDKIDDFAKRLHIGSILYFVPNSINEGLLAIIDKDEIKEDNLSALRPELLKMISNDNDNPIIAIINKI